MPKFSVLIIEDEKNIQTFMGKVLKRHDYQVLYADTGKQGLEMIRSRCPDLILLDLGLPDMDGVEIIKKIRSWSNMPIIVVSARSEDTDKVEALDAGADDYLTKPFSVEELLARLRVALRRVRYDSQKVSEESSIYVNGDLKIDYAAGCVYMEGKEIHLTPIEYKLLCLLAKHTGKVLTHNFIIHEVWGGYEASDTSSLWVFMATLRKKIEADPAHPKYIRTHIGVGYRMMRQSEQEG